VKSKWELINDVASSSDRNLRTLGSMDELLGNDIHGTRLTPSIPSPGKVRPVVRVIMSDPGGWHPDRRAGEPLSRGVGWPMLFIRRGFFTTMGGMMGVRSVRMIFAKQRQAWSACRWRCSRHGLWACSCPFPDASCE